MSEPQIPPPPPGGETPKKGLSTGAKIGIGCLVAALLVAGGCFVVTAFFVKKGADAVRSFAEDAQNDPDAAAVKAVELLMKLNPEVDVVSTDPGAGKITLREKRTGKVLTFRAEDIRNGKVSFESEGEKLTIDADQGEDGKPGALRVEGNDRSMVFGADTDEIPDWVPIYPGGRADAFSKLDNATEASGTFTIHTADPAEQVLAFYENALRDAGFEVETAKLHSDTASGGNLTARAGARAVNIALAAQEGETQGLVAFSEKK